jgi:hypothetical protein
LCVPCDLMFFSFLISYNRAIWCWLPGTPVLACLLITTSSCTAACCSCLGCRDSDNSVYYRWAWAGASQGWMIHPFLFTVVVRSISSRLVSWWGWDRVRFWHACLLQSAKALGLDTVPGQFRCFCYACRGKFPIPWHCRREWYFNQLLLPLRLSKCDDGGRSLKACIFEVHLFN